MPHIRVLRVLKHFFFVNHPERPRPACIYCCIIKWFQHKVWPLHWQSKTEATPRTGHWEVRAEAGGSRSPPPPAKKVALFLEACRNPTNGRWWSLEKSTAYSKRPFILKGIHFCQKLLGEWRQGIEAISNQKQINEVLGVLMRALAGPGGCGPLPP